MLAKTTIPTVLWPPIPDPRASHLLALQFQLEQSQWYSREKLHDLQQSQLHELLAHAIETVPYYHQVFRTSGMGMDINGILENWAQVPLLSRKTLIEKKELMVSRSYPALHGSKSKTVSSGTTGNKVEVIISELYQLLCNAILLRDHLWHQRDFSGHLVSIRSGRYAEDPDIVKESDVWTKALGHLYPTGPHTLFYHRTPLESQANILIERNPDYLIAYPGNILALTRYFKQHDLQLPNLKQITTMGEPLPPDLRQACKNTWGATIKDIYGAEETGNIALQCPATENYHIQSEVLYVEILDDDDKPCGPGETGKIVVTTLHNFAMPLIRYDMGDYAEVSEACPCGRGLPALKRIRGRRRNRICEDNDRWRWPELNTALWRDIAVIQQLQVIQKTIDDLEIRILTEQQQKLNKQDQLILDDRLHKSLGAGFQLRHVYMDQVPQHDNGKFEPFISEITDDIDN